MDSIDKNLLLAIILAAAWTIPWKGVALWRAARRGEKIWFIVMLVVNTLAILEILYIFVFSKREKFGKY
jgi:type IV secretory pathway TrbD component